MTIAIANTANTNTVKYFRTRLNELAYALSAKVLTTDSNTTTGNAAITGAFQSNALFVTYLFGGTNGVTANLNLQTNVSFNGAKTNLGLGANVTITTGNATHRVLCVNTSDYSLFATKISFSDVADANLTAVGNGQILVFSTAENKWKNFNANALSAGDASTLNGQSNAFYTNASNMATGTLPAARLSGSYSNVTGVGVLASLDIGNADTSITRISAGDLAVEGNRIFRVGGADVPVADGGTGASDAAGARTNLGLGTMATQNANNATITGGSITGITDVAIADGGTGASDAATALTNLGAAPLNSPGLTGTPTAPSAARYTANTQLATTKHVYDTVTNVPENAQTGTSYTLVVGDKGKMVTSANTSNTVFTVPSGTFTADDRVDLLQYGSGTLSIANGAGMTIRSSGGKVKLFGQYSGATLWFKSASEVILIGDLSA